MSKDDVHSLNEEYAETIRNLNIQREQIKINFDYLKDKMDILHDTFCPSHIGTWQQDVEAVMDAVKRRLTKSGSDAYHLTNLLFLACAFRGCLGVTSNTSEFFFQSH